MLNCLGSLIGFWKPKRW